MNKILLCILLCLPVLCHAQHYDDYARSFYDDRSDDFIISMRTEGDYHFYRIRNISGERCTLYLFTKNTSGHWVSVGSVTLDPNRKSEWLIQKWGTEKTLAFYFLAGRREQIPTVEEINKVESSY